MKIETNRFEYWTEDDYNTEYIGILSMNNTTWNYYYRNYNNKHWDRYDPYAMYEDEAFAGHANWLENIIISFLVKRILNRYHARNNSIS